MSPLLQSLLPALVPVAFTLLAAGTGALFALAKNQIGKIKSQKLRDLVATAEHFTEVVVTDIEAHERDTLVKDTATGKIPPGEGKVLAQLAVDRVKALLGTEGLADLQQVLGVEGGALGQYLGGLVEKHVANMPAAPSASPQ